MNVYYLICITISVTQNAICNCEIKSILTYLFRRRTIRRGQFVAKSNINSLENPASISAVFFSAITLPFQQHCFHHPRISFNSILVIPPASTSATFFSSLPLPFLQHSFHQSSLHFSNIFFITLAPI